MFLRMGFYFGSCSSLLVLLISNLPLRICLISGVVSFSWVQGVLLPNKFVQLASEKDVCISMAASVLDVCRKNPDRGVDLVLSVAVQYDDHLSYGLPSVLIPSSIMSCFD